jgi:hypothetical protein
VFFGGQEKLDLIEKWVSNDTSFKTVNYENTYSVAKPKVKESQFAPAPRKMNIVTNTEEAKFEDFVVNGEYSSVSLTGVKNPKNKTRYELSTEDVAAERPNAMRSRVVDDYMKSIVGSGKHIDYEKGMVVKTKSSLSHNKRWVDTVE